MPKTFLLVAQITTRAITAIVRMVLMCGMFSPFFGSNAGEQEGIFSGVPPSPAFDWQCKDYTARKITYLVKHFSRRNHHENP